MAINNLAQEFSDNAAQGLPQWQVYENMLAAKALETRQPPKLHLDDLDGYSPEELELIDPAMAIELKAQKRQIDVQRQMVEDIADKREEKQKEEKEHEHDDMRSSAYQSISVQKYDSEEESIGSRKMSRREAQQARRDIVQNPEEFIKFAMAQGRFKNREEAERYIELLKARVTAGEKLHNYLKDTPEDQRDPEIIKQLIKERDEAEEKVRRNNDLLGQYTQKGFSHEINERSASSRRSFDQGFLGRSVIALHQAAPQNQCSVPTLSFYDDLKSSSAIRSNVPILEDFKAAVNNNLEVQKDSPVAVAQASPPKAQRSDYGMDGSWSS